MSSLLSPPQLPSLVPSESAVLTINRVIEIQSKYWKSLKPQHRALVVNDPQDSIVPLSKLVDYYVAMELEKISTDFKPLKPEDLIEENKVFVT